MVGCYWYTHFFLVDHLVPSYFLTSVHKDYLMCVVFMCYASNIYLMRITPKTCEQVLMEKKHLAKSGYDEVLYESGKKCPTCNIIKLPRSKHCSVCDVCVADFDHHCYWTNGCVTRTNYLPFLTFSIIHAVFALYGSSLWFLTVLGNVLTKQTVAFDPRRDIALLLFDDPFRALVNLLVLMNEFRKEAMIFMESNLLVTVFSWTAAATFIQLAMFLKYHWNLLKLNRTTNELIKIDRIEVELNN